MANTEFTTILSVETGEAVQNIAQLRENIKQYKKELNDVNATEEENLATLDKLRESQNALKDAMYGSSKSVEQLLDETKNLNGSYNDLVHAMAELKSAWRSTTDATERADLGERIKDINDRLKVMDEQTGSFKRNVGNYTNSIRDAFSKTAGSASGIIAPLKGVTAGFKTLSATPVIAILGLLANIIAKVIDGLKSSEENTKAMTEALSIFSVVGDGVTKVLQWLGEGLGKIVGWIGKVIEKVAGLSAAMKERKAIAQEEQKILENERKIIVKNADAELKIAQLRQKAADKANNSTRERIAALEQAAELEKEISERAYKQAQMEYNVIKRRNALTQSSSEEKKAEAEAYAKMVQAETNYYNKTRELSAQLSQARKKEAEEAKKYTQEQQAALISRLQAEKKLIDSELEMAADGSNEQLRLQKESVNKQLEVDKLNAEKTIANVEERNKTIYLLEQKARRSLEKLDREHIKKMMENELLYYTNLKEQVAKGSEDYLLLQIEERQYARDTLAKMDDETNAQFQSRQLAAEQALKDALKEYDDWVANEEHQARENRLAELEEGSAAYLQAQMELKKYELDTLQQLEGESNETFRSRQLAAEKAYADARSAIFESQVAMMQNYAGAVSGIMGSIADILENGTEEDAKAAERAKNLRIASATIDTISGAIGAYMSAVKSIPAPMGAIVGALQAAQVTAAGIANISKIKSTQISADGSSATASTSFTATAPTIDMAVPQTALITSASEEQKLNDQKVYILSSDLEANGKKVSIQQDETSF